MVSLCSSLKADVFCFLVGNVDDVSVWEAVGGSQASPFASRRFG